MDRNRGRNAQKVIVAMSGGIDSSVAAALLKRAGFSVYGVFMRLVDLPRFREGEKKARIMAKILKIPFLSLDLRKEFKKRIINSFLERFKKGITPNPCVDCNNEIKFKLLFEKARTSKDDFFATGHYARLQKKGNKLSLLCGRDKEKDQTYFLWQLSQKQLTRTLFPVGNFTKKEVRMLAKEFNLPIFEKSESQEICFIPGEINEFLKKYLKTNPGKIVDIEGKITGQHQGLWFYTIGQRKGIKLPGGPYYVLDKNLKKNLLIVTKNEKDLFKKELIAKKVNWISGNPPHSLLKVKAKIRYKHKGVSAKVKLITLKKVKVVFDRPQRAITPGQSVVFYQKEELLGGGIIC
jgi:tRNA-specific 2-thiouridylase